MNEIEYLKIITPFKDKIFRIARRLLVSVEEAEDATQEVLLKLWNHRQKFKDYNSPEAFAMTMTKNWCFDRLKSKQAQNLKIVHNNYEDHSQSLQKSIEINDSLRWVEKYMEALPAKQKLILQLRDIENYEFNEIAKILDMSEATIRVSLSRARKTIREKLTQTHNYGIKKH
ncbi:sigma-70 family RNA polymerase sigma factor [Flavobacteriaceae bacterium]|nr:sigma-70 family RNA polymerase sigma factor [Flavobacteriaceae bacterium]MDB4108278.1 sigma-70 family RNA polymerase sigma factor [Flavobacteriaceae bacterium]MDC0118088.1 sigma-70 family RNA polymerase sigma factor [bacterium]